MALTWTHKSFQLYEALPRQLPDIRSSDYLLTWSIYGYLNINNRVLNKNKSN